MIEKPTHYPKWTDEYDIEALPVQICGVRPGLVLTEDGSGYLHFNNLENARLAFPDLDPYRNTTRFSWAMRGEIDGRPALRFETWQAEAVYSA